jgi:hypothetical protein
MSPQDRLRDRPRTDLPARRRFERLNDNLRTGLMILASFVILASLIMAWIVFSYIFQLAIDPGRTRELVDQWAGLFSEKNENLIPFLPAFTAPARWFAIATLGILAYLLTRIPLLLLQMGLQILKSCQDERRIMQEVLGEILLEIRRDSLDRHDAIE